MCLAQRRKGAKKPLRTRQRFAPLRLCGRNLLWRCIDAILSTCNNVAKDGQQAGRHEIRADAYARRDARSGSIGSRYISCPRSLEADGLERLAILAAATDRLPGSFRVCRHLPLLCNLRILYPPLLGQSSGSGRRKPGRQLLRLLETARASVIPSLLRRA